jgi:cellulose biosynthesis protein BcsQ
LTFDDLETEELYDDPKTFTVYNVIHPLSLGKGYTKHVHTFSRPDFGFDILIGDPRLSLKEDLLARDWSQAIGGEGRGLRTSFLFSELLTRFADYDYVFFDVGPSLGSINRSVLLACDYFVSPMTIDIFSLKAVENISTSIENWKKQLRTALENLQDQDALPDEVNPKLAIQFAGYVTQQYKAKTDGSGGLVAVQAYEKIMRRVAPAIKANFIEKLQPAKRSLDYQLGTIPNLFSLIPMAQFARRPIFALRAADGVRGAHFSKVKDAHDLFEGIGTKFETNLKKLS